MAENMVYFEVEIQSLTEIGSRALWTDSAGPWIDGGLEELMMNFTYAAWTAQSLGCAMSLLLASPEESLGQNVCDLLTKLIRSMGAIQLAEVRLSRDALEELRRTRLEP
jgi:hypothetical protein